MTTQTNAVHVHAPSAPATATAPPTPQVAANASPYRRGFGHSIRSELIKLFTLRSTWWSLIITAGLCIGVAVLISLTIGQEGSVPPVDVAVGGLSFMMLSAGILGAISVTGEYSTGMMRSTLTADPVRGSALLAKATTIAVTLFLSSAVIILTAGLLTALLTGSRIDWSVPEESWGLVSGASFGMMVCGLMGVAAGFLLRSGAGAIAVTVGILFVVPIAMGLIGAFPSDWAEAIAGAARYLPSYATQAITSPGSTGLDGTGPAYIALVTWAVIPLVAAWAVFRKRDA